MLLVYLPVSPWLGIARLLGNMAIGSIRFDGPSLDGILEGSSRSRSPGVCNVGSLEDLSFEAYCGGGPVQEKKFQGKDLEFDSTIQALKAIG